MVAFTYRMPSGIPGAVSRESVSTIEAIPSNASLPFAGFGLFGKIASGKFVPVGSGDAAAAVYGLLVRAYPAGNTQDGLGTSTPNQGATIHDVLRRGYMTVKSNAGTPALNGQVYVRVAAAAAGKPIGGIEAAADSTNTIAVTNCIFMGPADANGNVEIAFNI